MQFEFTYLLKRVEQSYIICTQVIHVCIAHEIIVIKVFCIEMGVLFLYILTDQYSQLALIVITILHTVFIGIINNCSHQICYTFILVKRVNVNFYNLGSSQKRYLVSVLGRLFIIYNYHLIVINNNLLHTLTTHTLSPHFIKKNVLVVS